MVNITSTRISIDPNSGYLVIDFTASKKPLWTGSGRIDGQTKELKKLSKSGREIAQLIGAMHEVQQVELSCNEPQCTIATMPSSDTKFRTLSVKIREVVANYCQCDLGNIVLSEAYDRAAERELTPPQLAMASEIRLYELT